jgi:hypothetical protein
VELQRRGEAEEQGGAEDAPNGVQRPTMTMARAMKPRPADMPSTKVWV